jgi:hypothetical protein
MGLRGVLPFIIKFKEKAMLAEKLLTLATGEATEEKIESFTDELVAEALKHEMEPQLYLLTITEQAVSIVFEASIEIGDELAGRE